MGANSKGQRSWSLETKIWKSFFAHIFVKSRSIYVKPRPKWSAAYSIHIISGNVSFLIIFV